MNRSSQLPTTSPSRGRQPGFTVMELLIVVGVMGLKHHTGNSTPENLDGRLSKLTMN
jgi:hypothetical protein